MNILTELSLLWSGLKNPFLIQGSNHLNFDEMLSSVNTTDNDIKSGDVVAIIGDFDAVSIKWLLYLISINAIIVPLTADTKSQHQYFFDAACVNYVVQGNSIHHISHDKSHPMLESLRELNDPGLVLFSTGTTGKPKAILHNLSNFLKRYRTPRPTLKTLSFLLFDHIGGLNTLLHTLYNKATIITINSRTISSVIEACNVHSIELLPTTPTFLRLMLLSDDIANRIPHTLKIITYGTERMEQSTLSELVTMFPLIDFRQTYGMSELGILRVKSESRGSLFMKIGGEGISTKVMENTLFIRSETRMLGYLNADSPFDANGWYNTKDLVEKKGDYIKITGRSSDVINVGGLKFMPEEVENICLQIPNLQFAKAYGVDNPITGQHVELKLQPVAGKVLDRRHVKEFLQSKLPKHMRPSRILLENLNLSHRFKKL
jgi:long-chain acyl-CoA synthetase